MAPNAVAVAAAAICLMTVLCARPAVSTRSIFVPVGDLDQYTDDLAAAKEELAKDPESANDFDAPLIRCYCNLPACLEASGGVPTCTTRLGCFSEIQPLNGIIISMTTDSTTTSTSTTTEVPIPKELDDQAAVNELVDESVLRAKYGCLELMPTPPLVNKTCNEILSSMEDHSEFPALASPAQPLDEVDSEPIRAYHCCQSNMCNDVTHVAAAAPAAQAALASIFQQTMDYKTESPASLSSTTEKPIPENAEAGVQLVYPASPEAVQIVFAAKGSTENDTETGPATAETEDKGVAPTDVAGPMAAIAENNPTTAAAQATTVIPETVSAENAAVDTEPKADRVQEIVAGAAVLAAAEANQTTTESVSTLTESASTSVESGSSTTESMLASTESTSSTTDSMPSTTESMLASTGSTSSTTESMPPSTESTSSTTESVSSTTESMLASTESLSSTTESMPSSTESMLVSTESTSSTTESMPSSTESTSSTTESMSSTSESKSSTSESTSTTTESMSSTMESISPKTESTSMSSTTESVSSTTESVSPTTESVSSTTESVSPTTESVSSTTESMLAKGEVTLAETESIMSPATEGSTPGATEGSTPSATEGSTPSATEGSTTEGITPGATEGTTSTTTSEGTPTETTTGQKAENVGTDFAKNVTADEVVTLMITSVNATTNGRKVVAQGTAVRKPSGFFLNQTTNISELNDFIANNAVYYISGDDSRKTFKMGDRTNLTLIVGDANKTSNCTGDSCEVQFILTTDPMAEEYTPNTDVTAVKSQGTFVAVDELSHVIKKRFDKNFPYAIPMDSRNMQLNDPATPVAPWAAIGLIEAHASAMTDEALEDQKRVDKFLAEITNAHSRDERVRADEERRTFHDTLDTILPSWLVLAFGVAAFVAMLFGAAWIIMLIKKTTNESAIAIIENYKGKCSNPGAPCACNGWRGQRPPTGHQTEPVDARHAVIPLKPVLPARNKTCKGCKTSSYTDGISPLESPSHRAAALA